MWCNEWIDVYPVSHDYELKSNTLSEQVINTQPKKRKKKDTKIPYTT